MEEECSRFWVVVKIGMGERMDRAGARGYGSRWKRLGSWQGDAVLGYVNG